MDWDQLDWKALARLRGAFLSGTAGAADYWTGERDLSSYDQTFAQRIGWKWDHVLEELARFGWSPPPGAVLDYGCGSGIAGRAYLDHFGTGQATELRLHDRSPLALKYASRRAQEKYPGLEITMGLGSIVSSARGVFLASHLLNELSPEQAAKALEIAATYAAVIWVEPGTFESSAALVGVREKLRARFHILAPCPHQQECGLLLPDNARHWCHHFAKPPPEVFTAEGWGKFAHLAGIDLSSLPLSYLVLDKRTPPAFPPGLARLIGTPRVSKHQALVFACTQSGLGDRELSKRDLPAAYRQLKRGHHPSLATCEFEGAAITAWHPYEPAGTAEKPETTPG